MKKVSPNVDFYLMSEQINKYWKDIDAFKKSLENKDEQKRYVFIDGPPFVTGTPHYGTLLSSITKDIVTRYWSSKGYYVRRVWGWDCHGLPIEEKVSKKFGLKTKADIEKFGIGNYVKECRNHVNEVTSQWTWYIESIGRWVDMENAYYTMRPEFNESVIWVFKKIWEKGLIYKGKRVSLFSTDTSTPVSEFEVAESNNYKDVYDLSIFVSFCIEKNSQAEQLGIEEGTKIVAWTTTPWTIPSNFALAVNPEAVYSLLDYNGQKLIIAKGRISYTLNSQEYVKLRDFLGKDLVGLKYKQIYNFFQSNNTSDFKIYGYDGVTVEDGTGVLHIAPGFGAEDFELGKKYSLSDFQDIDDEGNMTVGPWKGIYLGDANKLIVEDLKEKGNLLRQEIYKHRVAFFRGEKPLIYKAQDAYYIDVGKIKERMLELNQKINWIPGHFKDGRFADVIKSAPDWCISRTRYWATIMPIWRSDDGEEIVVGSIEEMSKYNSDITQKNIDGKKVWFYKDEELLLHRDVCDKIVLTKNGKQFKRIPDVLDCWLDSGSVPIAEYHYPFENKDVFEKNFPADFISEYVGQIRAWFNVLLRVSVLVFDDIPFKNVIVTGNMAGTDGRKMSKSFGNYPDPEQTIKKYGGDALRIYFAGSPLLLGNDISFNEKDLKVQLQEVLLPLWNVHSFLTTYSEIHKWQPEEEIMQKFDLLIRTKSKDIYDALEPLNKWLISKFVKTAQKIRQNLENYNIPNSVKEYRDFVNEISKWYIRASREKFASDLNTSRQYLETLYYVLLQFVRVISPITPFIAESIYQNLFAESFNPNGSVHLDIYPDYSIVEVDEEILSEMEICREIVDLGNKIRGERNIKLKQPLYLLKINRSIPSWMIYILQKELNVKNVVDSCELIDMNIGLEVVKTNYRGLIISLDTRITDELYEEGKFREICRAIQAERKRGKKAYGEIVKVEIFINPKLQQTLKTFRDKIEKQTLVQITSVHEDPNLDFLSVKILNQV
ncbi:isoleucine--tRNA ligase [Candidatus Dojkabacteria bacterium]|uniref:Isoleucine--tRNA ligase n=1 Tax=Candidatus Dojkabacteria bacterium TaxID=2099670 RepID=A0A3M0YYV4_9BACT|nr:MAG: isoleucine--tRNA ligase [Candidatus Dojkabacteria bacterium]